MRKRLKLLLTLASTILFLRHSSVTFTALHFIFLILICDLLEWSYSLPQKYILLVWVSHSANTFFIFLSIPIMLVFGDFFFFCMIAFLLCVFAFSVLFCVRSLKILQALRYLDLLLSTSQVIWLSFIPIFLNEKPNYSTVQLGSCAQFIKNRRCRAFICTPELIFFHSE